MAASGSEGARSAIGVLVPDRKHGQGREVGLWVKTLRDHVAPLFRGGLFFGGVAHSYFLI